MVSQQLQLKLKSRTSKRYRFETETEGYSGTHIKPPRRPVQNRPTVVEKFLGLTFSEQAAVLENIILSSAAQQFELVFPRPQRSNGLSPRMQAAIGARDSAYRKLLRARSLKASSLAGN